MSKGAPDAARFLNRATPPHVVTLVLVAGLSAAAMNVFLPSLYPMSEYFETDYAVIQLAVSGFLALTGILQLFIGPLADRYGRRPVLLTGISIYCVATVGCIFATDVLTFMVFRMMQATVAVGVVLSRAIVRDMVPADRAASMIGYVTMGMSLIPMLGPLFGGIMQDAFGWQSVFVALLVLGIAVLLVVFFDLKETAPLGGSSFRDQARHYPELLRSRRFWGYALSAGCASGCYFALLCGGSYVAGEVLGMSPSAMGMAFGVISVGYLLGNFMSDRYSVRVGLIGMMISGSSAAVFGAALALAFYAAGYHTPWAVFGPFFFIGLGNGLNLPSSNSGMLSVKPQLAGTASGLGGALMIGGGALISVTTGALLEVFGSAYPLMLVMLASGTCGILATLYAGRIEREVAAAS